MKKYHFLIGPEVTKPFSCSIHLSRKCIILINVKMPSTDGILTFISMINAISDIKCRPHVPKFGLPCAFFGKSDSYRFSTRKIYAV